MPLAAGIWPELAYLQEVLDHLGSQHQKEFQGDIICFCPLYMYIYICLKKGLALNNLHWLICHKTKPKSSSSSYRAGSTDIPDPLNHIYLIYTYKKRIWH